MPAKREDITDDGVRKLASYGCTQQEIADFFGCSPSTIKHRFAPAWTLGQSEMRKNIRKWQIRRALKGSDVMLIHLGKHYCGQNDKGGTAESLDQPPASDENGNPVEP